MEVEYGLVTSAALPAKIKQSDSFLSVDKAQWDDLEQYAKQLEAENEDERVMVLIVAQGTPEQQAAEAKRQAAEEAQLKAARDAESRAAAEKAALAKKAEEEQEENEKLRRRSKEIFNALYGR